MGDPSDTFWGTSYYPNKHNYGFLVNQTARRAVARARRYHYLGYRGAASWSTPSGSNYYANYQTGPYWRGRAGFNNYIGRIGVDTDVIRDAIGNTIFHNESFVSTRSQRTR